MKFYVLAKARLKNGYSVNMPPKYDPIEIGDTSKGEKFRAGLIAH